MSSKDKKLGRREVVVGTVTTAGVVAATATIVGSTANATEPVELEGQAALAAEDAESSAAPALTNEEGLAAGQDPEAALAQAKVHTLVAEGTELGIWRVEKVHPVNMGTMSVMLSVEEGLGRREFQLDVLKRDDKGVAHSNMCSVYLSNTGDGGSSTDELEGRGAFVLAHHLAAREQAGAEIPELLTHAERARQYPAGHFRV